MAMLGQTWKSEIRKYKDEKTDQTILQLTATGNNVHLYFTENSFDANKNEIIFLSDRATSEDKAPHEHPFYNLFRMNLDSGEITQISDESPGYDDVGDNGGEDDGGGVQSVTKTPGSEIIVYRIGDEIKKLNALSGETTTLFKDTQFNLGAPSIAANRGYIAFCRNEDVKVADGPNYTGFKERFYLVKDGRITLAYLDGSGWFDVFKDTHQVGHFQFCPDDSTLGSFCHEGPWNLVTQRMWLLDFVSREVKPCFRQSEIDSVGHEFWTHDGYIFFDNRGPGHDGTITSERTQAVTVDVAVKQQQGFIPFVGLANKEGEMVKKIDMPYYCNHYHANPDKTKLVGDDVDNIVLIDISGEKAVINELCNHKTSWHTQSSHCHPTWSWDGNRILYASDYGGKVNLYLVEV
jgi:oligogalacturonide lyase